MIKNIFDSHAHYNDERFKENQEEVINHVFENGVRAIINIGADIKTSKESIEIASKYDNIFAAVGIHPHDAALVPENYLDVIKELAAHEKVVAIGEIGLDYFYNNSTVDAQKKVFEELLILASELDLPVIIHSRDATKDCMELLEKYRPRGVVHCFSGSKDTAKRVVDIGMYISYTGVVTFKNANKIKNSVLHTPKENIMLETDCPYMAPEPHRGKLCTSDMIAHTASAIAEIKNMDVQELVDIATKNTCDLFNIKLK